MVCGYFRKKADATGYEALEERYKRVDAV